MDVKFYGRCHPDNVWALTGLRSCLEKSLQNCKAEKLADITEELKHLNAKLAALEKMSDTPVSVACMCAGHINNMQQLNPIVGCDSTVSNKRRKCCDSDI